MSSDVIEWKEGVNRLRTTTHAELIKLAAAQSLGRAWPDVFFRSAETARSEGEAEPAPVEPRAHPRLIIPRADLPTTSTTPLQAPQGRR